MTRQTKKYLAAVNQSKALAIRTPRGIANDKLYERLENEGWWWNGEAWTNEPRYRRINVEGDWAAGAESPDVLRVRIEVHPDRAELTIAAFRRFAEVVGWEFLQQSKPYPNRPPSQLWRFYLMFKIGGVVNRAAPGETIIIDDEGEIVFPDEMED